MDATLKRLLFWVPRILCILIAIFLSLFSLDVFSEGLGFGETFLALLIHLIPVFIVIAVLILAWRWGWVGAILFIALAALYMVMTWGRFQWSVYALIAGPLVVVGILFLLDWILRSKASTK